MSSNIILNQKLKSDEAVFEKLDFEIFSSYLSHVKENDWKCPDLEFLVKYQFERFNENGACTGETYLHGKVNADI